MSDVLDPPAMRLITIKLAIAAIVWGGLVALASGTGVLRSLYPPLIGLLIASGIIIPSAIYAASPVLQAYFRTVGVYPLSVIHVTRAPAALVFFWYGAHDLLPAVFWMLAGFGDLISGLLAVPLLRGRSNGMNYWPKHLFGIADLAVALTTGLTLILTHDPRIGAIRDFPLSLIPLFGVGILGTSHVIAVHLLWTERRDARVFAEGDLSAAQRG